MITARRPHAKPLQSVVPRDLVAWVPEARLVYLALQATGSAEGVPSVVGGVSAVGEPVGGPMVVTLMAYCYARGVLTASDIGLAMEADSAARYVCGSRRPDVLVLLQFRRRYRSLLVEVLARLLGLAWQEHVAVERQGWSAEAAQVDFPAEAAARIDRAIHLDSMMLDE